MQGKVASKQNNSRMCIVCGIENQLGIDARFYNLENNEVVAIFTPKEEHQSYPGRMHGGLSAAILDETIGRGLKNLEPGNWAVTIELTTKYRKPVPLGVELKAVGRITNIKHRLVEGTGEIYLPNGEVAVTAEAKYIKMSAQKITDCDFAADEWMLLENENDPQTIEIPECSEA
ncbi:MAG: PaaI family thioesterase [Clostridia bacterium]|nr:PaaI family thioesterase [Clostridia bacterium]MDD4571392.1 PaaI family thioesterase [Clostridia bacterium]